MNNYQVSTMTSIDLIAIAVLEHETTVKLVPKFYKDALRIIEIRDRIKVLKPEQEKDLTGITVDLKDIQFQLIDSMVDVAGVLQAHAHEKKNNELLKKTLFTENSIKALKRTKIESLATLLITEVEKLSVEDLATCGLKVNDIADLKKLQQDFKKMIPAKRKATIERSGETEEINKLIEEATGLKRNSLDKLVSQFKKKDPEFYRKYMAASKIIYKRGNHKPGSGDVNNTTDTPKK